MRLSVPGNMLLFGEYAVLEEGGLGIACAHAPWVLIEARPYPTLHIESYMGARRRLAIDWPPRGRRMPAAHLLLAVLETVDKCMRANRHQKGLDGLRACIRIDSSGFFAADGTKLGFGSSAAVTVALCSMLLRLTGLQIGPQTAPAGSARLAHGRTATPYSASADTQRLFHIALTAHRRAHGGRGSGYDVATSTFGGIGLFRGGARPEWRPLRLRWPLALYTCPGGQPTDSGAAIARYERWRAEKPIECRAFVERSNYILRRFCAARDWPHARDCGELARDNSIRLGRSIGVPSDIPDLVALGDAPPLALCKASGAGNELIYALLPADRQIEDRTGIGSEGAVCI